MGEIRGAKCSISPRRRRYILIGRSEFGTINYIAVDPHLKVLPHRGPRITHVNPDSYTHTHTYIYEYIVRVCICVCSQRPT